MQIYLLEKPREKKDGQGCNSSTLFSTFPHSCDSSLTSTTGGSDPSNLALAYNADRPYVAGTKNTVSKPR